MNFPLPEVEFENVPFWTDGERGVLSITRCRSCRTWLHPPVPVCRHCLSTDVGPEPVAGTGTVHTFTVNHQPWLPDLDVPYVVAIVELDEQPDLRVSTGIVGLAPHEVRIGLRVRVRFEQVEDVWLPYFEPSGEPDGFGSGSRPVRGANRNQNPRPTIEAAVSGIGQSDVGRRLGRSPLSLTVYAALAAAADAGLSVADIDGVATWPGAIAVSPGFSGVGVSDIQDALGLQLSWFSGGPESAGQLGAVFNAAAAVTAGLATHVLCFRTVWESTAQTPGRRASVMGGGGGRSTGLLQYLTTFGALSAANWSAMMATRHFHEFGTTREQLAAIPLTARANAGRNPKAVYRDPMTLADYLGARMISEPLGLYDCDVPVDASTAVIVSRSDAAAELRRPPLAIDAIGSAHTSRPLWDQFDDLTSMSARDAAAMLWAGTDLRPADVDLALLYDGFSFLTMVWLEALGFCGHGEGGAFVEGGKRIALDGELPLNTHGGQLSAGRLHGYGHLHEAAVQLWGEGGDRQVSGEPKVAAVGVGGGTVCGALLLRNDA